MHQAVSDIFPETVVFGCRFHLGQAWFRKIRNIGYTSQFNSATTEFCDYVIDHYITNNSIFPLKIWAKQSPDRKHTTNACGIFHSDFNLNCYH